MAAGFWVVLECDLETHGFLFLGWRGNPSDDPRSGPGVVVDVPAAEESLDGMPALYAATALQLLQTVTIW